MQKKLDLSKWYVIPYLLNRQIKKEVSLLYKNKIKIFRKEKGMTIQDVAKISNISAGYLCHLEKGTRNNPSLEVMEKISKALNKSVAEVFFL